MKYYVLLTLDLPNATAEGRKKFYEHLKEEKWKKLENLTTAWKCSFTENVEKSEVISICKKDLKDAASYSGVSEYNAAFQAGQAEPVII